MTQYAIRGGEEGGRRLELLAGIMAPSTSALLDRAGIGPDMRCIDLGCGAGHVSRMLAQRVGSGGQIVGLDIDEHKLALATCDCVAAGLEQVVFRAGSVSQWCEPQAYDVVYGRFILSHLREPAAIVASMVAALRPRGVLVLEDIDFSGAFCQPPNQGYERYCSLYSRVIERRGGDADRGRQLYRLCRDAGVADVDVRIVQPVHGGDRPEKAMALSTMVNVADAVMAEGLATADEIGDVIAELERYTADCGSLIGLPRIFQVIARP